MKANNTTTTTTSQGIRQEENPSLGNKLNVIIVARHDTSKENVKNLKESRAKLEVMKKEI